MTFLTAGFLWGMGLVSVPIVMHLVMHQQPKHLVFPALRFIRQREQSNRRRLRLRHLILLLLRCAAIALLALALARPSLHQAGLVDQEAPIAAALVFDTAPRMDYLHENHTRLVEAQGMAETLLKQLPPNSDLGILDSGNVTSVFSSDPGAAKQRVERLATTAAAQPLPDVIDQAARLLATSDKARKEIYIFTDLARSSWTDATGRVKSQLEQLKDCGVYVIDVGVPEPENFGLEEVRLTPGDAISKNTPLRIETRLTRIGPAAQRGVGLYLLDRAGKAVQRDQQLLNFDPLSNTTAEFQVSGLEPGLHQGYLKIEGEDGLAADNQRYFTVEVRQPWKVLLVAPPPAARYTQFLDKALAPPAFVQRGENRFRTETIALDKLSETALDDCAAVCLVDPTPPSAAAWAHLADYVKNGGGLAIFLGRNARPAETFNEPAALELLPGPLLREWQNQSEFLAPHNLEHPALAFFKRIATAVPWDAARVFQFWQFGPLADGVDVVIPYRNGKPALLERPVGKGRVLTFTTPVSELANDRHAWNQLTNGGTEIAGAWPFLALSNEMMLYLAHHGGEHLQYDAGEPATVRLSPDSRKAVFSLSTPRGEHVPQSADPKEDSITITATDDVGNYRLEAGGETGVLRGFSVNSRPPFTQLERLPEAELKDVFGGVEFRVARNRDQIDRAVSIGRVGRELYPFLMLAIALALACEQLLANLFYRGQAPREKAPPAAANATAASSPQPAPMALAP